MRKLTLTLLALAALASAIDVAAETARDEPAVKAASVSRIQVGTGTSLQSDTGWD
ncbi:hypothetical protein [Streptomyces sp. NPDC048623]|uniref:hypothetical protein n=1 Tax=Streptomyces sp. NPDC048623 TaxID=3155761 RepID=UPI003447DE9B